MRTIILAAGGVDYRNKPDGFSGSQLLTLVNGRPIISWVIGDTFKTSDDSAILVINENDHDLQKFCAKRYHRNPRFQVLPISSTPSILHSILKGLSALKDPSGPIAIHLGDTVVRNLESFGGDCVYVSDFNGFSDEWCVVKLDPQNRVEQFYNKIAGISAETHQAVVGRYEFSDAALLKACVENAIDYNKTEISDAIKIYDQKRPIEAIHILPSQWIDFGHLEGISIARTRLMESRPFNSLSVHSILPIITKTSTNAKKLKQELFWYETLPSDLKSLVPRVFEHHFADQSSFLKMEYYGYGTLAEKFLFFDLSLSFWRTVLVKLFDVTSVFKSYGCEPGRSDVNVSNIYFDKTFLRLDELRQQNDFWIELLRNETLLVNGERLLGIPKLRAFILDQAKRLSETAEISIVHGDFCFNNILYDISTGIIKLIDPRGEFGKADLTIFGDRRYDIAKLRHSFCGNYDHIIEGLFHLEQNGSRFAYQIFSDQQDERDHLFDKLCIEQYCDPQEIRFIEALLFISMVPIHRSSIDKQIVFFLQGMKKLNDCFRSLCS